MAGMDADFSQEVIIKRIKNYLIEIYRTSVYTRRQYSLGAYRGYVHGLGDAGIIPRTTEYTVCAQDFDSLTFRRANVTVVFLLKEGFLMKNGGDSFVNDDLIEWVLRSTK